MDLSKNFQPDVSIKKLTPPKDVILNYVILSMVFLGTTAVAVLISKDGVSCVAFRCPSQHNVSSMDVSNGSCEMINKPPLTAFLNSECSDVICTVVAFFLLAQSLAFAGAHNLCWVLNPRCFHTLQQFAKIAGECYEAIGTPEQISCVLQSIRENEECIVTTGNTDSSTVNERTQLIPTGESSDSISIQISPSINSSSDVDGRLDEASKAIIKSVYYKVKKFGDVQKSSTYFCSCYFFRVLLLVALGGTFF